MDPFSPTFLGIIAVIILLILMAITLYKVGVPDSKESALKASKESARLAVLNALTTACPALPFKVRGERPTDQGPEIVTRYVDTLRELCEQVGFQPCTEDTNALLTLQGYIHDRSRSLSKPDTWGGEFLVADGKYLLEIKNQVGETLACVEEEYYGLFPAHQVFRSLFDQLTATSVLAA